MRPPVNLGKLIHPHIQRGPVTAVTKLSILAGFLVTSSQNRHFFGETGFILDPGMSAARVREGPRGARAHRAPKKKPAH